MPKIIGLRPRNPKLSFIYIDRLLLTIIEKAEQTRKRNEERCEKGEDGPLCYFELAAIADLAAEGCNCINSHGEDADDSEAEG